MPRWIAMPAAVLMISWPLAFAQVEKGDVELGLGGSLGWGRVQAPIGDADSAWGISASGSAGYFVSRRFDVGGFVGFGYMDFETGHRYNWGLGPSFNVHFRPATKIVPLVGSSLGWSETTTKGSLFDTRGDSWFVEVRGGADFFIAPGVSIKLLLRYSHAEFDDDRGFDGESDSVATVVGLSFFLRPSGRN